MNFNFLSTPRTLTIMPTYTCTAACKDCGTLSSPNDKSNIDIETIFSAIDQAKNLNFSSVVFTGGEATLRWRDLLKGIEYAVSSGFPTRLVTNAHWASTEKRANTMISELLNAGLTEINYSTGDEHVRFIPIENIITATKVALEQNLRLAIMVELKSTRHITKRSILDHPSISSLSDEQKGKIIITESPWMPLNPLEMEHYPEDKVANRKNLSSFGGCDSVLQTYVIQANNNVGACCGLGMRITPELNVGRTNASENFLESAINAAENDFLKIWLRYKGPNKILAWVADKNQKIKWENIYAHKCQACLRLYKDPLVKQTIKEHYSEMLSEVLTTAFISDVYIPSAFAAAQENTVKESI